MADNRVDLRHLRVRPLAERRSKHSLEDILLHPDDPPPDAGGMAAAIETVAGRMKRARDADAAVILAYGAHLV